ncbi:MAG: hypothetical protein F6K03_08780 [Kamptonema sp. SIO4C4]|nr:hypothetical protein [Kamptonema sp. SIO4C4]
MSRKTPTEANKTPTLHPVLESALGCVDVQVEEELARYRRQKARQKSSQSETQPSPQAPVQSTDASQPGIALPDSKSLEKSTAEPPQSNIANYTQQPIRKEESDPNPPQDYLESSQELLRNATPPEPEQLPPNPSNPLDRLLTPMGVSSILLLGVAFTLLGIAIFDPDRLSNFTLTANNTNPSPSPESPASPDSSPSESPSELDIEGPNLATDEFSPVDLDSLSTLETDSEPPSPSPTEATPTLPTPEAAPSPSPQAPIESSDLTTAILSPELQQPAPSEPSPSPSPSPTPEAESTPDPAAVNAPQAPTNSRYYYVILNYNGQTSLETARNIVPEAYLLEFPDGVKIQMGVFDTEASANKLVERLETAGLDASVTRPGQDN